MVTQLDYSHFDTGLREVFGHFEPDRPSPNYSCFSDTLLPDVFLDPDGIGYAPEGKYPFGIDPRDVRPERKGTGGYDKFVVAFDIFYSCRDILDFYFFVLPVYRSHPAVDSDIDIVLLPELFRSSDYQSLLVIYELPAQKVGQAAGGIRDVRPLIEH